MGTWPALSGFVMAHGQALILPLAVIEGPVVAVVAGILAARGLIDWYWALAMLVAGDVAGDLAWYSVGRTVRSPLSQMARRFGMTEARAEDLERRLGRESTRMLLIGKWTHAVGCVVLLGAGMLRVPLVPFVLVNFLATVPKSALLLAVGYFAAHEIPEIRDHTALATVLLLAVGLAGIGLGLRAAWRPSREARS